MKAVVYRKYGPPDVMRVEEVSTPTPDTMCFLQAGALPSAAGVALVNLDRHRRGQDGQARDRGDVPQALAWLAAGNARGKVVIRVAEEQ